MAEREGRRIRPHLEPPEAGGLITPKSSAERRGFSSFQIMKPEAGIEPASGFMVPYGEDVSCSVRPSVP
ncbi:hypothetical protein AGR6A_pAt20024 [Agrobacterium sp. NCPPB 925]|nr:hypothetical protein AGR6A_pAt20024 [Agrobacterium sp. NCPPB 925]